MKTKAHDSVDAMVGDVLGQEAVAAMKEHEAATALVFALTRLRNERGLSQRQLARKLGWSPSKVSRIEAAADADLKWGEVTAYAAALGTRLNLWFEDPGLPTSEQIKQHVFAIHEKLESLAALAAKVGDDRSFVDKINAFYGEVLLNFLLKFGSSYDKLSVVIRPGAPLPASDLAPAKAAASLPAPNSGSLLPA